jgi:hypothetical protein
MQRLLFTNNFWPCSSLKPSLVRPIRGLLLHRKLFQIIQLQLPQRTLLRRAQLHLRHRLLRDLPILVRLKRLQPPRRTQAPLTPLRQPCNPQIITLLRREIEKLLAHNTRNRMVAKVSCARAAVAVAVEARHGLAGEELQGLAEDVERVGGGHGAAVGGNRRAAGGFDEDILHVCES